MRDVNSSDINELSAILLRAPPMKIFYMVNRMLFIDNYRLECNEK